MKARCPICGKRYEVAKLDDLPTFPFCSRRCRTIDQARWADGAYVIPTPESPPSELEDADDDGSD